MSQKIHSQDSNFEETWRKMDEIDPLTPKVSECKGNCKCNCLKTEDAIKIYQEAAAADDFIFGDYDYTKEWINDFNKEG